MSDKNIDPNDVMNAINHLTQFDDEVIAGLTDLSESDKALVLATKADREETARRKKLISAINGSINDFMGLGKSLITSGGSFEPIKKVLNLVSSSIKGVANKFGGVGKAISVAADIAEKAAEHMIDSFEKAYTSFEKLSGTGIVSTFDDLQKMSADVSVTMDQLSSILEDRGGQFVNWGGTALKGAKEFEKLNKSVRSERVNFQLLGITVKELTTSQLDYMDLERKSTRGQLQFDMTYKRGFMDYLDNLTTLSTLTGQTRDDLKKKMASLQEETRWRLFSMDRDKKQRESDNNLVLSMSKLGPIYQKGISDLMAAFHAGVEANGEEAQAVTQSLARGGISTTQLFKQYLGGIVDWTETTDKINRAAAKDAEITGRLAPFLKDGVEKSIQLETENAKIISQKTTKALIAEEQAAKKKPPTKIDQSLAEARIRMNDMGVEAEQLAVASDTAAKSMNFLSKKLNKAITEIYQSSGKNVPELLKIVTKETDARDKISDVKIKLEDQTAKKKKAQDALAAGGDTMGWSDKRKQNVNIQDADAAIKKLTTELQGLTDYANKMAQKRKELENITIANKKTSAVGGTSTDTDSSSTSTSQDTSSSRSSTSSGSGDSQPAAQPSAQPAAQAGSQAGDQTGGTAAQPAAPNATQSGATGASTDASTGAITDGQAQSSQANMALPSTVSTGKAGWPQIYLLAKAAGDPFPEVTASQWAQESGWGKHMSGKNNPFGQKASSNQPGSMVMTRDVVNGRSIIRQQKFRDYASVQEAVAEHVRRWAPMYASAKTPEQAISMIAGTYATGADYAAAVSTIIRQERRSIPTNAVAPTPNSTPVITPNSVPTVVSGPSTGHNVVMQGEQTVIPTNQVSNATASPIVSTFGDDKEFEATRNFLTTMNSRVDDMIDLMDDKITVQRRSMTTPV